MIAEWVDDHLRIDGERGAGGHQHSSILEDPTRERKGTQWSAAESIRGPLHQLVGWMSLAYVSWDAGVRHGQAGTPESIDLLQTRRYT